MCHMKTAISIPDEIFEEAERMAKRLGISRSELYAKAVHDFVERLRRTDVTERLNEVHAEEGAATDLDRQLAAMQALSLRKEEW